MSIDYLWLALIGVLLFSRFRLQIRIGRRNTAGNVSHSLAIKERAIFELSQAGWQDDEIAVLLGWSHRAVTAKRRNRCNQFNR